eukprot:TRINITY_DN8605_c0_g1_i1.p1 TRINITY_DN8605_c0_g1~~TRINITY_DN8605_c0_g1_i1.p1  ORF type:complete len:876 (+),score=171.86 TRINITY_DN8605_c0_g1_i1:240-2867(+)
MDEKNIIIGVLFVSLVRGKKYRRKLKREIENLAKSHPLATDTVPYKYKQVWTYLNKLRSRNFLLWNEYRNMVVLEGMGDSMVYKMTEFFHNVGEIIWFKKTHLEPLIILNPQWLANLLSTIVTISSNFHLSNGIVPAKNLEVVWKEYHHVQTHLLYLFQRFEIIFPLKSPSGEMTYIVPTMFVDEPTEEYMIEYERIVGNIPGMHRYERVYRLKFPPPGFFSRFIVNFLNMNLENEVNKVYWRSGFIVEYINEIGLISHSPDKQEIKVIVHINYDQVNMNILFLSITSCIESMCDWLNVIADIGINCPHCFENGKNRFYNYESFVDLWVNRTPYIVCNGVEVMIVDMAPDITMEYLPILNGNIKNEEVIGEGGFGKVYKGELYRDGEAIPVAVKVLKEFNFKDFKHEVFMMGKFDHPNLVKLYGISLDPPSIILEHCAGGSLNYQLYSNYDFEFTHRYKLRCSYDIAKGIDALHNMLSSPIMHRDIRPTNIFVNSLDENDPVVCKIGDLGISHFATPFISQNLKTWQWSAPEVLDIEDPTYDESCDIYSFGIVMSEIFLRIQPFVNYSQFIKERDAILTDEQLRDEEYLNNLTKSGWDIDFDSKMAKLEEWDTMTIKRHIIHNNLRPSLASVNPRIASIISSCWDADPIKRPPIAEVVTILEDVINYFETHLDTKDQQEDAPSGIAIPLEDSRLNIKLCGWMYQYNIQQIARNLKNEVVCVSNSAIYIRSNRDVIDIDLVNECRITSLILYDQDVWCGCDDGSIYIYENIYSEDVTVIDIHTDHALISDMKILGDYILSVGHSGYITVWDIAEKTNIISDNYGESISLITHVVDNEWWIAINSDIVAINIDVELGIMEGIIYSQLVILVILRSGI